MKKLLFIFLLTFSGYSFSTGDLLLAEYGTFLKSFEKGETKETLVTNYIQQKQESIKKYNKGKEYNNTDTMTKAVREDKQNLCSLQLKLKALVSNSKEYAVCTDKFYYNHFSIDFELLEKYLEPVLIKDILSLRAIDREEILNKIQKATDSSVENTENKWESIFKTVIMTRPGSEKISMEVDLDLSNQTVFQTNNYSYYPGRDEKYLNDFDKCFISNIDLLGVIGASEKCYKQTKMLPHIDSRIKL